MRILVTVASKHGGTGEIAARVAEVLRANGHEAELVDPENVTGIEGYDAVVLGSAVYTGHWMPAAREFATRFAADLTQRKVWLLSSGLSTAPAAAANSPAETQALIKATGALGHRAFGGQLDRSVLNVAERAIIAAARAKEGDHRDMDAVAAWAETIAAVLARTTVRS